jgi:hypothetical protein
MKHLTGLKINCNEIKPKQKFSKHTNSNFLFVEEEAILGRFQSKLSITKER